LRSWLAGPGLASLEKEITRRRTMVHLHRHLRNGSPSDHVSDAPVSTSKIPGSSVHLDISSEPWSKTSVAITSEKVPSTSTDCPSSALHRQRIVNDRETKDRLQTLVVAFVGVVHELQLERGLSCSFVATHIGSADSERRTSIEFSACVQKDGLLGVTKVDVSQAAVPLLDEVTTQRKATDKTLLEALTLNSGARSQSETGHLTPSPSQSPRSADDGRSAVRSAVEKNALLLDWGVHQLRELTTKVIIQRQVVDGEVGSCRSTHCVERHDRLCWGETGYNSLLAMLLEWLTSAGSAILQVGGSAARVGGGVSAAEPSDGQMSDCSGGTLGKERVHGDSLNLLVLFKEQLGQERALVLSVAALKNALHEDPDMLRSFEFLTVTRSVIGDLLLSHADLGPLLKRLAVAETALLASAGVGGSGKMPTSVGALSPRSETRSWFEKITRCINEVQRLILHTLGGTACGDPPSDHLHLRLAVLYREAYLD